MKIVAASDIHGSSLALAKIGGLARENDCDLILLAGDITVHHLYNDFLYMLEKTAKHGKCPIVLTLGNHDFVEPKKYFPNSESIINGDKAFTTKSVVCLIEQCVEYKNFKIWGSPYTNRFGRWNYMRDVQDMKFDIPQDCDILVTHSPPFGYGDLTDRSERVGSEALILAIKNTPNLKLCVFGHVHEMLGYECMIGNTTLLNVSCHDVRYNFTDRGIRIVNIQKDGVVVDFVS